MELTPSNCAQIRLGLRLSVKSLADVLAVYPKTVDNWERRQRSWSSGLAGDFMAALGSAMCQVGADDAWGPSWLSRRQRLVWILRAAATASRDSCFGTVSTVHVSLEALQPHGRIRYRPTAHHDLEVEREPPPSRLCLRVRRRLGLQMKEFAQLLAVSDNTIAAWERGQPLHGLEEDVYAALAASLQRHDRAVAWGPPELPRHRRLLHVLQHGLAVDPTTCAGPPPALCVPEQQPVLALPGAMLRVMPEALERREPWATDESGRARRSSR
ncbi:hypothetical protein [Nannocystis sp. SCPEA4]|uniref:hypothetical protein n=1 Tax=Nannocystis sp. SCPEA4 TaxID=2996787 RepID=UPI002271D004|nr:hypothetical protein [Nannocystis sp. SCPEA4]MCY1062124.1 hypothetical protein [Nannocystis sp. SCPEA4]